MSTSSSSLYILLVVGLLIHTGIPMNVKGLVGAAVDQQFAVTGGFGFDGSDGGD